MDARKVAGAPTENKKVLPNRNGFQANYVFKRRAEQEVMMYMGREAIRWAIERNSRSMAAFAVSLVLLFAMVLPALNASSFDRCLILKGPVCQLDHDGLAEPLAALEAGTMEACEHDSNDGKSDDSSTPNGGIPENEHETKLAMDYPRLTTVGAAHLLWGFDFAEHPVKALCEGHGFPPTQPPNHA
ncbi:MAG: hypothetical protein ACO1SV_19155 [Fimbriimonas sp.]